MSDLGNREVLADNLRRLMDKNGINRADLAGVLKTSYSTVNDWYNGKSYPRIDMIERLANYFGVNKADLIERKLVLREDLTEYIASPTKQYLMDKIAKADDRKLDRIKKLMELIDDEEDRNW